MKEETISYSKLLIDFIDPLITGQEDEQQFLDKLKLGKLAWNYSVSDLNDLPLDNIHKDIFLKLTQSNSALKEILNKLVLRKSMKYSQHNQFIFEVGIRKNKFGQKVFFAESIPTNKIDKI